MPLPKEKTRYTLADALEWDERERIEVIGGEPVLPATPVRMHQEVSGEIYRQLANYLDRALLRRKGPKRWRLWKQLR